MKRIVVVALLSTAVMFSAANAKDALVVERAPVTQQNDMANQHIAWHKFRHELVSYPRVNASMSNDVVITMHGFVDYPGESDKLDALARKVLGATKVVNRTATK